MADVWPVHFGNQSYDDSETPEFDVEELKFGGGHTQNVPNGPNYIKASLSLRFMRRNALANEMYAWLLQRARVTPFYCAFPDATPGNYLCTEVSRAWAGPNHSVLTVTLKQNFNL